MNNEVMPLDFNTGRKMAPPEPEVLPGKIVEFPQSEPSRILVSDAQGNVQPSKPDPINLTPFPDGYVFKFGPNPARENTFLVFDVNETPIAICGSPQYAGLICNAVRMLFLAVVENQRRQQQVQPTN